MGKGTRNLPQTDFSILRNIGMPYSGQTSHFRRLETKKTNNVGRDTFIILTLCDVLKAVHFCFLLVSQVT